MKALVPLARSAPKACQRLAEQIIRQKFTSREIQALYRGWQAAGQEGRLRLLENPRAFLCLQQKLEQRQEALGQPERLLQRAQRLARQTRHLHRELCRYQPEFSRPQLAELRQSVEQARSEWDRLLQDLPPAASSTPTVTTQETMHAEPREEDSHPSAPPAGARDTDDQENIEDLARGGQEGDRLAKSRSTVDRASEQGRALSRRNPRVAQDLQGQP